MKLRRPTRNTFAAFHDVLMAAASFIGALWMRLGDRFRWWDTPDILPAMVIFAALAFVVFVSNRLYRGMWRYASVQDLAVIAKAVTLAILLFYPTLFLFNRLEGVPRSVPWIHWMLLLMLLGGPRFVYRTLKDRRVSLDLKLASDRRIPVLLLGATDNAELFLRESLRSAATPYRVVGIVDDDPARIGHNLHNVRIHGNFGSIPSIVEKLTAKGERPQKLLIADDRLPGAMVRGLLEKADALGIPLARLPRLTEFKAGAGESLEIRPIAIEDLLGRPQNTLDRDGMRAFIEGRRVLVTGGGGTIGSELVRQVAAFGPSHLVVADASEYNLYLIDGELADKFPALPRRAVLCDVRDAKHVDAVFAAERPEVVFHAAALKHVPMCEDNSVEAVRTNVFGTRNVADACVRHAAAAMVLISTDKAVNPTSVMGATKRVAESYCQALGGDPKIATQFITVRFGNVLGSTGSVVPLFQRQLAAGGPLTVTHPDMVRYFMTVREAVELVLEAASLGSGMAGTNGMIFVLDMGQAVKIEDLAMQMIKLAGLKPHVDVKIVYTGLRPGEKLYEELFYFNEPAAKTKYEGVMLSSPRQVEMKALVKQFEALGKAVETRDPHGVLAGLKAVVPEFRTGAAAA